MQHVHDDLTKSQRALLAYLNKPYVPLGFRGNPYTCADGRVIELEVNPKNLSRYEIYMASMEEWAVTLPKTVELPEFTEEEKAIYDSVIAKTRAQQTEKALEFCNSYKEKEILAELRKTGSIVYFSEAALTTMIAPAMFESIKTRFQSAIETERKNQLKLSEDGHTNGHGRARFPIEYKTALEYLRERLFEGLIIEDLMTVIEITKEKDVTKENITKLGQQLELHRKFAFRKEMKFNGMNFIVEASPFAEKGILEPISDLDIVVYPQDEEVMESVKAIANPEFEHADGAILIASLAIGKLGGMCEEIQTDIPDILRKAAVIRDVTKETEILAPIIEEWQGIAMEAMRVFAQTDKFAEFYVVTPWGVTRRYQNSIHPDKLTNVYYSMIQRLGGELVFDDKAELWIAPAYYWRFSTKTGFQDKAAKARQDSKWSFRT